MTSTGNVPGSAKTAWHVALLGGYDRRGAWQVPTRTVAISPVGGIDPGLTEATVPDDGATIVDRPWELAAAPSRAEPEERYRIAPRGETSMLATPRA